jgi:hypothetical protein
MLFALSKTTMSTVYDDCAASSSLQNCRRASLCCFAFSKSRISPIYKDCTGIKNDTQLLDVSVTKKSSFQNYEDRPGSQNLVFVKKCV